MLTKFLSKSLKGRHHICVLVLDGMTLIWLVDRTLSLEQRLPKSWSAYILKVKVFLLYTNMHLILMANSVDYLHFKVMEV